MLRVPQYVVFTGKKNELLWILEHNPVITAGTSSSDKDLLDKNLAVIKTTMSNKSKELKEH